MNKDPPFWWPYTKTLIAISLIFGLVVLVFTLLFVKVPENQVVVVVIGGFITSVSTIVQYYFGSSQSSQDKSATIHDIVKGNNSNARPPGT
jgi:hypothetical protein